MNVEYFEISISFLICFLSDIHKTYLSSKAISFQAYTLFFQLRYFKS